MGKQSATGVGWAVEQQQEETLMEAEAGLKENSPAADVEARSEEQAPAAEAEVEAVSGENALAAEVDAGWEEEQQEEDAREAVAAEAEAAPEAAPAVDAPTAEPPSVLEAERCSSETDELSAILQTPSDQRTTSQLRSVEVALSHDRFLKGLDSAHMSECCKCLGLRCLGPGEDVMTQGR